MAAVNGGFRALDEKSLIEYIRATPAVSFLLGDDLEGLTIKEVGDGNLNFVYIVISSSGGSVVIKQVYFLHTSYAFACDATKLLLSIETCKICLLHTKFPPVTQRLMILLCLLEVKDAAPGW